MPKVHLIDYTGKGANDPMYAARLLVLAKNTRLLTADAMQRIQAMTNEELMQELQYIARTIPASHEFVNVTFLVEGVTRACAQQITRTRTASYAMQSQRVQDVSDMGVHVPASLPDGARGLFTQAAERALEDYRTMLSLGAAPEDARGILPLNTRCNLLAHYNLRTLADLVRKRSSGRVQAEYREIVRQMRGRVLEVWPWAEPFFASRNATARAILTEVAEQLEGDLKMQIWKAIDQLEMD